MNDNIQKLINSLNLAPMKAYADVNDWNSFYAPYQALAKQQAAQDITPNFNYYTLNPAKQNFASGIVADNGYLTGGAGKAYQDMIRQYNRQNESNIANLNNQLFSEAKNQYTQMGGNYYTSPTAFTGNNANASAVAPIATTAPVTPVATPTGYNSYQVKSGDTLGAIYNNLYKNKMGYNDFINQAVSNNNLKNANTIYSGSTLKLPGL